MASRDHLFDLIHSLTPSEKRFFKIHASRHVIGSTNQYVALFDAIHAQSTYDEPALKAQFAGEPLGRNLPSVKHYLSQLILQSMQAFHRDKTVDRRLRNMLSDLEFLRDKKLNRQFDRLYRKTRQLAEEYEKHTVLLELLEMERFRFKERSRKGLVEGTDAILQEMQGLMENKMSEVVYTSLLDSLYIQLRKGSTGLQAQIEAILSHGSLQAEVEPRTFVSRMYYHQTHAIAAQLQGRHPEAVQHYSAVVANWTAHPQQYRTQSRLYRKSLANYLASLHLINDYAPFPEILAAIHETERPTPQDRADVFRLTAFYALISHLGQSDFRSATDLALQIEKELGPHQQWIDPTWMMVLSYNVAAAHFFQGEYQVAQIWLNRVVHLPPTEHRKDLQSAAHLLLMATHLQRHNFDLLEAAVQSLRYRISKTAEVPVLEGLLVGYFAEVLGLPEAEWKEKFFRPLHAELQRLEEEGTAVPVGFLELSHWVGREAGAQA